jgi:DNA-binding response OmpR family regulator
MRDEEKTILIVDDEPDIVVLLAMILEQEGFRPVVCSNGTEALEALGRGVVPAAVLLDLMMPGMSGFQLCRLLKSRPDLRDIPVAVLSARTQALDRYRAEDSGADVYLTKPFDIGEVVDCIRRLSGQARLQPSGPVHP